MISTKTLFYISVSYIVPVRNKIIPQPKFVKKCYFMLPLASIRNPPIPFPLMLLVSLFQSCQKELSQMKWNYFLSFYKETAETTIWWNVNINLQSVHFYDQIPKSRTNEQQVQVFMSLTSVSNISQLKIKEKFVLQLLP